jgi:ribosomal protein S14
MKEPTTSADGKQIRTCTTCGVSETRTISINGITCEHEYSDWFIIKKPTQIEEGKQIRTCLLCGNTLTQMIPAIGEGGEDTQTSQIEVSAGCNAMLSIPAIGIGLLSITTACVLKKRKKD